ncbi:MAG: SRPBCC family protein [Chloroflexota bacterium]
MTLPPTYKRDPEKDLVLERTIDVAPELVWKAWTTPEHLVKWFTPKPWETVDCKIDLRPGGIFSTTMRSPEGEEFPGVGCYLDVVPGERIVWSSALGPGFRPQDDSEGFAFTAIISIQPEGSGTKYTAVAIHGDIEDAKSHENMGFYDGWGTVVDQMVAYIKENKIAT